MNEQRNENDPVRRLVDSTLAVAFARFFMPVALAVIGWLMVQSFSDLKTSNEKLWNAFSHLTDIVNTQSKDVAVLQIQAKTIDANVNRLSTVVDAIKLKQP